MPELHVRNLPPELHDRLRQQAISQGRSMSAEAVVLLRQAVGLAGDRHAQRQRAVEQLRAIRDRNRLPSDAAPAEELVREDRDAAT